MKKIILMGRSECGKTTLTQALKGDVITYHKTQYINHFDVVIDTPGEYAETASLARALALYSYEADVVGLLASATEPYTLYPPNITCMVNREVISTVVRAIASTATAFRARAAFMERKPSRRIQLPLDTLIMPLTPVPQSVHPQCG